MKNSLVPIAVFVIVVACVVVVKANQTVGSIRKTLDEERYQRITTEEKLQITEQKLGSLTAELESSKSKLQKIQQVMDSGELEKSDLSVKMDSLAKEKTALEQRIQELETFVPPTAQ